MVQFDTLGHAYERSALEFPFREHLEHHSFRHTVGDVVGLRVLDLGCGSGLYTRRLATWGAAKVTGIDVSEGMLDTARAHAQTPEHVDYLYRDATRPTPGHDPRLDGRFDLVGSVYVLCYAATVEQLSGFFTTARRALGPEGGRLVAMTLNPDYGRGLDYYSGYGFTLTQDEDREGAPVTLQSTLAGNPVSVTAHWWSRRTYEHAAASAGFTTLSWTEPTVSDQGVAQYGEDYWAAYLKAPQAVILHAQV